MVNEKKILLIHADRSADEEVEDQLHGEKQRHGKDDGNERRAVIGVHLFKWSTAEWKARKIAPSSDLLWQWIQVITEAGIDLHQNLLEHFHHYGLKCHQLAVAEACHLAFPGH